MKLQKLAGATSEIWQVFIRDSSSTTGGGLTGLTNASSGLTAYYHRDTDTTATAIALVTMTVGTFTSSGFKEIDATNMPGWYQFCPPNAALAAGAKSVGFHLKGVTNMAPLPIEVQLIAVNIDDAVRMGMTALPNAAAGANGGLPLSVDASGRVDVLKINGTSQTARDIGASVLLSAGTGTGQLDFTSGVVKANLAQILGTALTETAGQIAAGFKKLFDVAAPVFTLTSVNQTGDNYARIGAAGAGLTALGDTRIANLDVAVSTRATPTNITAGTITTVTNLTNAPTSGDLTATMKASVTTAATAATPTIASVSGSVGSVAGNVGGNVVGSVGSVTAAVTVTGTVNADIKKVNGVTVNGDGAGTPWGP